MSSGTSTVQCTCWYRAITQSVSTTLLTMATLPLLALRPTTADLRPSTYRTSTERVQYIRTLRTSYQNHYSSSRLVPTAHGLLQDSSNRGKDDDAVLVLDNARIRHFSSSRAGRAPGVTGQPTVNRQARKPRRIRRSRSSQQQAKRPAASASRAQRKPNRNAKSKFKEETMFSVGGARQSQQTS